VILFRRAFDGMSITSAGGSKMRVYEPAWWQFWRWIYWALFARAKGHASVSWEGKRLKVRFVAETLRLLPSRKEESDG